MKIGLVSLLVLVGLVSCSTNPMKVKREIANLTDVTAANSGDVYPYRVRSSVPHDMKVINDGTMALYERIRMIREAKNSLELEYFIFSPDRSGRLVVSELVKAAQRGVKVRILVDKSIAVFALDEYYAKVLKEKNIELRYYNAASAIRLSTAQFRNHRKLIVRDGIEAITGGRNIGDEYFHLAGEFNFLDRDVWLQGEIVEAMKDSFNIYWDAKIVETPKLPLKPIKVESIKKSEEMYKTRLAMYQEKLKTAQAFLNLSEEDIKILDYVMNFGERQNKEKSNAPVSCPVVSFATDREGGNFLKRLSSEDYHKNYRILRKEIALWMKLVDDEVLLDSPYFLNDDNSREILNNLLGNKKKITILTNSLASTDAVYVSTVFTDEVKKFTPNPLFNAYIYKATYSGEAELYSDEIDKSIWGTHSKTMHFNKDSFMIGTYNVDNRSNFYNSEMAIFCQGSEQLALDVEENIRLRMKNSYRLNAEGVPDDGTHLLEGNTADKKRMFYILKAPSKMLQFLL